MIRTLQAVISDAGDRALCIIRSVPRGARLSYLGATHAAGEAVIIRDWQQLSSHLALMTEGEMEEGRGERSAS